MTAPVERPGQDFILDISEVKAFNTFGITEAKWESATQRNSNGDIVTKLVNVELTKDGQTYHLPVLDLRKRAGAINFDVDLTHKFTLLELFSDEVSEDESSYGLEA